MTKPRPLTDKQTACLIAAEPTLYGDLKLAPGFGRIAPSLRKRGLAEGVRPDVYLTPEGRETARALAP